MTSSYYYKERITPMDEFAEAAFREIRAHKVVKRRALYIHAIVWGTANLFLFLIWLVTGGGHPWFLYAAGGWGIGLAAHAATVLLPDDPEEVMLREEQRKRRLAR